MTKWYAMCRVMTGLSICRLLLALELVLDAAEPAREIALLLLTSDLSLEKAPAAAITPREPGVLLVGGLEPLAELCDGARWNPDDGTLLIPPALFVVA